MLSACQGSGAPRQDQGVTIRPVTFSWIPARQADDNRGLVVFRTGRLYPNRGIDSEVELRLTLTSESGERRFIELKYPRDYLYIRLLPGEYRLTRITASVGPPSRAPLPQEPIVVVSGRVTLAPFKVLVTRAAVAAKDIRGSKGGEVGRPSGRPVQLMFATMKEPERSAMWQHISGRRNFGTWQGP